MIHRRLKIQREAEPAEKPAREQDLALVIDADGNWHRVPEDPRDIFNDPFVGWTEWEGEVDHKAYDKL